MSLLNVYMSCVYYINCVRPFGDGTVPFDEGDDRHGHLFGFHGFNHDDMFRQLDEAFSHMMKNFGMFDNQFPDEEQGIVKKMIT